MNPLKPLAFDPSEFLSTSGPGRRLLYRDPKQVFFTQGQTSDCVFYIISGRVRLTVVSIGGKEAILSFLTAGDFIGEDALTAAPAPRKATTTAITPCSVLRIERNEMVRTLHQEHEFSKLFLNYLVVRNNMAQADLADHLLNCSEKRLARTLLLMAGFGEAGESCEEPMVVPPIRQEALALMVGTTRARVSFFMNRFRKLGYIEYQAASIHVHKSLQNIVLENAPPVFPKPKVAPLSGRPSLHHLVAPAEPLLQRRAS